MMSNCIEMVTFKVQPQVSEDQLVATNDAMEVFLNEQSGFLYRSLSNDGEGNWFDIIYWQDDECAQDATAAFEKSAICQQLMPLIDQASCKQVNMKALSAILAQELAA